jgi:hypothetical protein
VTPEEALFRAHLEGVPFRSGRDRERWGFPGEPSVAWPHCILWVQCEPRFSGSERVSLRFDATGYPASAPNAVPWDVEKNQVVPGDKWPKGPGNVSKVFNPSWNGGALYAPCDRIAMAGHEAWKAAHPQWWWTADSEITLYLEFVHRCLNPRDHEQ